MPLLAMLPATGPAVLPVAPPAATLVQLQPERIAGEGVGDRDAGRHRGPAFEATIV